MKRIKVLMYTYGMASGHLSRVNAVYKGFKREKIDCEFFLVAPRSKYLSYLNTEIVVLNENELPESVDIFFCDWKATDFVYSLAKEFSMTWIGLKRLGTIRATFPDHFHIIGIEPNVKAKKIIWPIISTWCDELITREEFNTIVGSSPSQKVALLCENGAYASHPEKVLNCSVTGSNAKHIRCSNNPYFKADIDLDYYPIARLFSVADHVVIGGGYNSIHEAICFSENDKLTVINVGGDDQKIRIKYFEKWREKSCGDSQAHVLARYAYNILLNVTKLPPTKLGGFALLGADD